MEGNQHRIPNRLRRFRRITGLTQIEVAEKLGLTSVDRVSIWEKGTGMPNSINLLKLALLYNVLPHELYIDYLPVLVEELELKRDPDP